MQGLEGLREMKERRNVKSGQMMQFATMAVKKMRAQGIECANSDGFALLAYKIKQSHPRIRATTKHEVILEFIGSEAERVVQLTEYKKARRQRKNIDGRKRKQRFGAHEVYGDGFYLTHAWRSMRYEVLRERGARCEACGATARDGCAIHVDHIKPRSKYPELELAKSNLQVLCEACNLGKMNYDETDWRSA